MTSNNINQDLMEQIESYLLNEMSVEERQSFQAKIDADPALKKEVDLFQSMILSIEAKEIKSAIKGAFNDVDLENKSDDKPKSEARVRSLTILKYVIPLAAVLTAAIFYFNYSNPSGDTSLYADLYEMDPGLPTAMGKTAKMKFYDGMVDYKMGDFESALNTWQPLLADDPLNDTLQYYVAVANMENGDLGISKNLFSKLSIKDNSTFQNKAIWYETLLWLKEENYTEAKNSLDRIQNASGDLGEKVQLLKAKLSKF